MSFEWIDPFEQQERADRAERRAASAFEDGQRAVVRTIDRAAQNHFREKLDEAVASCAEMVALHCLKSVGASMSYQYFNDRFRPAVSEAFRTGCKDVIGAVVDKAQVRTRFDCAIASMEETMTVTVDTVEPVRVYRRFAL